MSGRVLVTGSEGFAGKTLCGHLGARGYAVLGCDVAVGPAAHDRRACDIADPASVAALLDWCGPLDYVVHLAAITFVPEAAASPARVMEINLGGSIHLMAALREHDPKARLLFVGSSECYGPPQALPVAEDHPLAPANPYAISKAAADQYAGYFHRTTGFDVVRMRPFNHSGPGQSDRFVLSSFARQIAEIEAGLAPPVLRTGNLEVARDFTHVDDIVAGYELALRQGEPGAAYNLCSGKAQSLQAALDTLLELSDAAISVEQDPARMRSAEVPEVRGAYDAFAERTGWRPGVSFEALLRSLLDYWRVEIQATK